MSWQAQVLTIAVIVLCFATVQCRLCTRTVEYKTVKPYVEQSMCNKSYEEDCGFWTYAKCTRYEMVPCMLERNRTLTQYKFVVDCCPGYIRDPDNNETCINTEIHNNGNSGPGSGGKDSNASGSGSKSAVLDQATATSTQNQSSDKSLGASFQHVENVSDNDGKLFGLTKGAYAGIVCSVVFLFCVIILVSVRLYKRRRSSRLKAEKQQKMELEARQSMMSHTDKQVQA